MEVANAVSAHAWDYEPGHVIAEHTHERAQLLYAPCGVMRVAASGVEGVVPSRLAVWIPAGCRHRVTTTHRLLMRTLYVDEGARDGFPRALCVVQVSDLLRESILALIRCSDAGQQTRADHLRCVVLDELEALEPCPMQIPIPRDPRLRRIARHLDANPADTSTLTDFSTLASASERTLARLFRRETGMTFGQWRRQRRVMHAIERLCDGTSVTATALDVGYESASAFIDAFRSVLGVSPGRFLACLHGEGSAREGLRTPVRRIRSRPRTQ